MKYLLTILLLFPLLIQAQSKDTVEIPAVVAKQIAKDLVVVIVL